MRVSIVIIKEHDQYGGIASNTILTRCTHPNIVITPSSSYSPQTSISITNVVRSSLIRVELPLMLDAFERLKVAGEDRLCIMPADLERREAHPLNV